jgi:hypothetical protein
MVSKFFDLTYILYHYIVRKTWGLNGAKRASKKSPISGISLCFAGMMQIPLTVLKISNQKFNGLLVFTFLGFPKDHMLKTIRYFREGLTTPHQFSSHNLKII